MDQQGPTRSLVRLGLALGAVVWICSSCKRPEFRPYTLDVHQMQTRDSGFGNLIVSHNAAAVFPLDLSREIAVLETEGPDTILEVQSQSACDGSGRQILAADHELVRNIEASGPLTIRDVADIQGLHLELAYRAAQDDIDRVPGTFCLGLHFRGGGWVWDFTPIAPHLDEQAKVAVGELSLGESNVDIVGVLFDSTTVITGIRYEARHARQ